MSSSAVPIKQGKQPTQLGGAQLPAGTVVRYDGTTGTAIVWVGTTPAVRPGNGIPLYPYQSLTLSKDNLAYAIVDTGSSDIPILYVSDDIEAVSDNIFNLAPGTNVSISGTVDAEITGPVSLAAGTSVDIGNTPDVNITGTVNVDASGSVMEIASAQIVGIDPTVNVVSSEINESILVPQGTKPFVLGFSPFYDISQFSEIIANLKDTSGAPFAIDYQIWDQSQSLIIDGGILQTGQSSYGRATRLAASGHYIRFIGGGDTTTQLFMVGTNRVTDKRSDARISTEIVDSWSGTIAGTGTLNLTQVNTGLGALTPNHQGLCFGSFRISGSATTKGVFQIRDAQGQACRMADSAEMVTAADGSRTISKLVALPPYASWQFFASAANAGDTVIANIVAAGSLL